MTQQLQKNTLRTDRGYWVRIPKFKTGTYNGWLTSVDNTKEFHLWITEIGLGFALSGSTVQSELTRSFFPRNFSQPVILVRGQAFDQQNYRELGEFIRDQQLSSLRLGQAMHLTIPQSGHSIHGKHRGRQRGHRRGISAGGYVLSMETGAAFGEFIPEYEFSFTISRSHAGVLGWDRAATKRKLKSWNQIFEQLNQSTGFVNDPDTNWIDQLADGTRPEQGQGLTR